MDIGSPWSRKWACTPRGNEFGHGGCEKYEYRTLWPRAAKAWTMAAPMPEEPPVTTTFSEPWSLVPLPVPARFGDEAEEGGWSMTKARLLTSALHGK
ncbi:hypothetical protein BCR44DRAFT_1431231 [Catenaria anguillulae PL171]|uniref:Uncharacterized protein n=1 Tax=Catenaria anguillulae PL171 TaxID=765915 RepID=A0A1Y2HT65_9FUNG|nr:hypothetical protein BCR44DRAFT_1431231 [Catenaria anguillulae PL171]